MQLQFPTSPLPGAAGEEQGCRRRPPNSGPHPRPCFGPSTLAKGPCTRLPAAPAPEGSSGAVSPCTPSRGAVSPQHPSGGGSVPPPASPPAPTVPSPPPPLPPVVPAGSRCRGNQPLPPPAPAVAGGRRWPHHSGARPRRPVGAGAPREHPPAPARGRCGRRRPGETGGIGGSCAGRCGLRGPGEAASALPRKEEVGAVGIHGRSGTWPCPPPPQSLCRWGRVHARPGGYFQSKKLWGALGPLFVFFQGVSINTFFLRLNNTYLCNLTVCEAFFAHALSDIVEKPRVFK